MKSFFEAHIWPQRGKLYRMVLSWVKDRALAEDVLQMVFEKAFQQENELRNHPNLMGWLVKSMKNEVFMHYRQTKRLDSLEEIENLKIEEYNSDEIHESVRQVMFILGALPAKQRDVFQLREVEGLTYEEIAAHLEISLDQVKVNLYRARQAIRNKMTNQNHRK